MASRHALFRTLYTVRFTPWDGHPRATSVRDLADGPDALPPAAALDAGCGTGDTSIYLAQHGWQVTGVDFVPKALDKARAKARAAGVSIDFLHADVTHLSRAGISPGFGLIVDNGCFHGMSDGDRDLNVHEIGAAAAPGARLVIVGFTPAGRFAGPAGVDQDEIQRRFTPGWRLLSVVDEPRWTQHHRLAARLALCSYVLQRQS